MLVHTAAAIHHPSFIFNVQAVDALAHNSELRLLAWVAPVAEELLFLLSGRNKRLRGTIHNRLITGFHICKLHRLFAAVLHWAWQLSIFIGLLC